MSKMPNKIWLHKDTKYSNNDRVLIYPYEFNKKIQEDGIENYVEYIQNIEKSSLVDEIESLREKYKKTKTRNDYEDGLKDGRLIGYEDILYKLNNFKVKENLTWEDIRELYIIFAEVDADIEFSKTDIKPETIGYYQEVLKRFKAKEK